MDFKVYNLYFIYNFENNLYTSIFYKTFQIIFVLFTTFTVQSHENSGHKCTRVEKKPAPWLRRAIIIISDAGLNHLKYER